MNILYLFLIITISIFFVYFISKNKEKEQIITLFFTMSILCQLLSFKTIKFQGLSINANCITTVSLFTLLYAFLEYYDKKNTKKLININFMINIFASILLYLTTISTQSLDDTVGINMKNIFLEGNRILIAYPISMYFALNGIMYVYNKVKKIYDNMFITTTVSFLSFGLMGIMIFNLISYLLIYKVKIIIELILLTYVFNIILTIIYSFLLMLIFKKKVK